jgi:hypothetical protein
MPLYLINHSKFTAQIVEAGKRIANEIANLKPENRTESENAQVLNKRFKDEIKAKWVKERKEGANRMNTKIAKLKKRAEQLTNSEEFETDPELRIEEVIVQKEIEHLEDKRRLKAGYASKANWATKAEVPSKFWSSVNRQVQPKQAMQRLQIKPPAGTVQRYPTYTSNTDEMNKEAVRHHRNLQDDEYLPITVERRQRVMTQCLSEIPAQRPNK